MSVNFHGKQPSKTTSKNRIVIGKVETIKRELTRKVGPTAKYQKHFHVFKPGDVWVRCWSPDEVAEAAAGEDEEGEGGEEDHRVEQQPGQVVGAHGQNF